MELIVNGRKRNVNEDQIEAFEAQVEEVILLLTQTNQTLKTWVETFNSDSAMRVVLAQAGLKMLATDIGIAFLRKKIEEDVCASSEGISAKGCPLAPHRAH